MSGNKTVSVVVGPKLLAEWMEARRGRRIPVNKFTLPYALGAALEMAMHEDIERWKADHLAAHPLRKTTTRRATGKICWLKPRSTNQEEK